jgi:hypothetical protein
MPGREIATHGIQPLLKHVANKGRALELCTTGLGRYEQANDSHEHGSFRIIILDPKRPDYIADSAHGWISAICKIAS